MAHAFTTDEKARMVLAVFRHYGATTGETVRGDRFAEFAQRKGWDRNEMQTGLDEGVALGWFEASGADGARLSKPGFDVIRVEQRSVKPR